METEGGDSKDAPEPTDHLTLCEAQVKKCFTGVTERNRGDLVVAMMHHDCGRTSDGASGVGKDLEARCDFILCGHEHSETWAEPTNSRAYKVRAGSFYLRPDYRNACNIIEVDLDNLTAAMLTVHYRTNTRHGGWVVDRDNDPMDGRTSPDHRFDSSTGLFSFVLRRDPPISLPPVPPLQRWQQRSELLRTKIIEAKRGGTFKQCLTHTEVLEQLHKLHDCAKTAMKCPPASGGGMKDHTKVSCELRSLVIQTVVTLGNKDLGSLLGNLDQFVGAEDISDYSRSLVDALSLLSQASHELAQPILPSDIACALLEVIHSTEQIFVVVARVQKHRMREAHIGLSKMAEEIGPPTRIVEHKASRKKGEDFQLGPPDDESARDIPGTGEGM